MTAWASEAEADAYLIARPNTGAWFESGLNAGAYLLQANDVIRYDPDLSIPDSPTAAQLTLLKNAEIELAFYILVNPGYINSLNNAAAGIKSERIGSYSVSYDTTKSGKEFEGFTRYPVQVSQYLSSFKRTANYYTTVKRAQENII